MCAIEQRWSEALLFQLLEEGGVAWRREMGDILFSLTSGGMTWDVACRFWKEGVLVYGRWPFRLEGDRRGRVLEDCGSINSRLLRGSVFLTGEGRAVFRTWADLSDPFSAREALSGAIAYNTAVITRSWGRLARSFGPGEDR